MLKCYKCEEYNDGKGSKKCLRCAEFSTSNILPRSKPGPDFLFIPSEIIENIISPDLPQTSTVYAALKKLDPPLATMLLQRYILGMTNSEISDYHNNLLKPNTVTKKINQAVKDVNQIIKIITSR